MKIVILATQLLIPIKASKMVPRYILMNVIYCQDHRTINPNSHLTVNNKGFTK